MAVLTPGVYVAVTTFHVEMLPVQLMLAIAAARERVPVDLQLQAEGGSEDCADSAGARHALEAALARDLDGQAAVLVRAAQTQWRSDIFDFGDRKRPNFATQQQLSAHHRNAAFARASVTVDFVIRGFQAGLQLQPPLPAG